MFYCISLWSGPRFIMEIPIPNPGQYPPTMSCTQFSARNSFEDQLFADEIYAIEVHDDVIKWNHFPRNWPFVRGIHWSPVNSQHKGQWCGALMFSLIFVWINDWVNNIEAGEWRRRRGHYDVTVMTDRSTIKALGAIFLSSWHYTAWKNGHHPWALTINVFSRDLAITCLAT